MANTLNPQITQIEVCEICGDPVLVRNGCEKCGRMFGPCCNSVEDGLCVECVGT